MKMFDEMVRTLTDVRYVSGLKKNLISSGTLDKIGYRITSEGGVMKVARGSLVVMKGKLNGSLYALDGSTILGSANISTSTMSDHDTKLWHLRLVTWEKEVCLNFLNKVYLMARNLGTLGFGNIVFMGNTRGLVSNPPYTTLREF